MSTRDIVLIFMQDIICELQQSLSEYGKQYNLCKESESIKERQRARALYNKTKYRLEIIKAAREIIHSTPCNFEQLKYKEIDA